MSPWHVHELMNLERLVDVIGRLANERRVPVQPVLDSCRALLATFVHVAIEQRAATWLLSAVDGPGLERDAQQLAADAAAASTAARALVDQRVAVARRRIASWERTRERAVVLDPQLSAIAERVRLAYEEATAPERAQGACGELHLRVDDRVSYAPSDEQSEWAPEQGTFELAVDPEILDLGRSGALAELLSTR
jgi:hypothetical protein